MPGDYTKIPRIDRGLPLMAQGRVMVDADWNELVGASFRRTRIETIDVIGRAVVPRETPDGFAITLSGGKLGIGIGRIYVDGLLAENRGRPPFVFDRTFEQMIGTGAVDHTTQPWAPTPEGPTLPASGTYVVFVDVWQREVTSLEMPALIDPAIGIETSTRVETVWQVRTLPVGGGTTCDTPSAQIPEWTELTRPSGGRLTVEAVGVPAVDDPCSVSRTGGYRGIENRLYRVEVHVGGDLSTARFKWSRDNASVGAIVTGVDASRTILSVQSTGRDRYLRFHVGDWVEVTSDDRELASKSGEMRRVKKVDDLEGKVELVAALPADLGASARNLRVRRWDQRGQVLSGSGNVVTDLEAPTSDGVIAVQPSGGGAIQIEDGIQVTFAIDPSGGTFRVGDHWTFVARAADGSVEALDKAPPRGVHHHYARLATITTPGTVDDCRTLWPPEIPEQGGDCSCTVCVSPEQHASGDLTIQDALEKVKSTGGTVCLLPGMYKIAEEPIDLEALVGVSLVGHGIRTVLVRKGTGPAIRIRSCSHVTLRNFAVQVAAGSCIVMSQAIETRLERLSLTVADKWKGEGIGAGGVLTNIELRDNVIDAPNGIVFGENDRETMLVDVAVLDNQVTCSTTAIGFGPHAVHGRGTRVARNLVDSWGGEAPALVDRGQCLDRVLFEQNDVRSTGDGLLTASNETSIVGNRFVGDPKRRAQAVRLRSGTLKKAMGRCEIAENRVRGYGGAGIAIDGTPAVSSLVVRENSFSELDRGGVIMARDAKLSSVEIAANRFDSVMREVADAPLDDCVIGLHHVTDVVVRDNVVLDGPAGGRERHAIRLQSCGSVRVVDNDIGPFGPTAAERRAYGIRIEGLQQGAEVASNLLRREGTNVGTAESWTAIAIESAGRRTRVHVLLDLAAQPMGTAEERRRVVDELVRDLTVDPDLLREAAEAAAAVEGGTAARPIFLPIVYDTQITVHDNTVRATRANAAIVVAGASELTLSDNQCRVLSLLGGVALVDVTNAKIVAANGNVLRVPAAEKRALRIDGHAKLALTGNVVVGQLDVIPPPSAQMLSVNVVGP